jgi:hypothetical protein
VNLRREMPSGRCRFIWSLFDVPLTLAALKGCTTTAALKGCATTAGSPEGLRYDDRRSAGLP